MQRTPPAPATLVPAAPTATLTARTRPFPGPGIGRLMAGCVVACGIACAVPGAATAAPLTRWDPVLRGTWDPHPPGTDSGAEVRAVVDPRTDDVLLARGGGSPNPVTRYDRAGGNPRVLVPGPDAGGTIEPRALGVHPASGDVYVSTYDGGGPSGTRPRIIRLSAAGTVLGQFGAAASEPGDGIAFLRGPADDLAVSPVNGDVYALESDARGQVKRYRADGSFVAAYGPQTPDGATPDPTSTQLQSTDGSQAQIDIDPRTGDVLVLTERLDPARRYTGFEVLRMSAGGTFVSRLDFAKGPDPEELPWNPVGLETDPLSGDLLILAGDRVHRFDAGDGSPVGRFGQPFVSPPVRAGQLVDTRDLAVDDATGDLYVHQPQHLPRFSLWRPACAPVQAAATHATRVTVALSCLDTEGRPLDLEVVGPPVGGTLGAVDQASRAVSFTPDAGFTGTATFRYRATNPRAPATAPDDSRRSEIATATITVAAPVTGPPTTTPPSDDPPARPASNVPPPPSSGPLVPPAVPVPPVAPPKPPAAPARVRARLRGAGARRRVTLAVARRIGARARTTYRVRLLSGTRDVATGTLRDRTLRLTVRKTRSGSSRRPALRRLRGTYTLRAASGPGIPTTVLSIP